MANKASQCLAVSLTSSPSALPSLLLMLLLLWLSPFPQENQTESSFSAFTHAAPSPWKALFLFLSWLTPSYCLHFCSNITSIERPLLTTSYKIVLTLVSMPLSHGTHHHVKLYHLSHWSVSYLFFPLECKFHKDRDFVYLIYYLILRTWKPARACTICPVNIFEFKNESHLTLTITSEKEMIFPIL